MHPLVKLPKFGQCPICLMDLIPMAEGAAGSGHPRELTMTAAAVGLADIQTMPVQRKFMSHNIRLQGKIDERDYDGSSAEEFREFVLRHICSGLVKMSIRQQADSYGAIGSDSPCICRDPSSSDRAPRRRRSAYIRVQDR